jgi:hypothetical protein
MSGMRWWLAVLLLFLAVNAVGGGVYGLAGAEGVPRAWLAGSPFRDFRVPGALLIALVGGSCGAAGIALLRRWGRGRLAALLAGAVLVAWIAAQVAIIGYVSWLQPAVALAGVLVIGLAAALPAR